MSVSQVMPKIEDIREMVRRTAVEIIVGTGVAIAVIGVALLVVRTLRPEPAGKPAEIHPSVGGKADLVAIGTVSDANDEVIDGATISLATFNASGEEVARVTIPVDSQGIFRIWRDQIPVGDGAAIIAAEAENHLSAKVNVTFRSVEAVVTSPTDTSGSPARIMTRERIELQPPRVHLRLKTFSPWLPLILFLPGFFGLLLAIAHLTGYAKSGLRVSQLYAFGAAGLWGAILLWVVGIYVLQGHGLIRFFWDDLILPSGVLAAAFIGTMVYVAYSMHEKDPGFFVDAPTEVKRKLLLAMGGRILVAPYVALIGHAIMSTTFPSLNSGAFAAFFGFFCGLWIKPVLEALNDIGNRFLAPENRQAVADRMSDRTLAAPAVPVASAALMRPEAAFLSAVEQARAQLLPLKNVIGVEGGMKYANGEAVSGQAIVVYVYEKTDSVDAANRIPATIAGFQTDVVPLPPSPGPNKCRGTVFNLSWEKIHGDRIEALGTAPAAANAVVDPASSFILLPGRNYFTLKGGNQLFDVMAAYKDARTKLADDYEFVVFCIDWQSFNNDISLAVGDYYIAIYNEIAETNHYARALFDDRAKWNTTKLRGCQVHTMDLTVRVCMHELAHAWSAYVTYNDRARNTKGSSDLLLAKDRTPTETDQQGLYHWGADFDDGVSCVDYDERQWLDEGQNFKKEMIGDSEVGYCPLDLYLMGLKPASEVLPFRLLRDKQPLNSAKTLFTANAQEIRIDDVTDVHGTRKPDNIGRTFRQAFVMISADLATAKAAAGRARAVLTDYELKFSAAVDKKASVSTRL